tara:strand:+ start:53 stop:403 length:351 start_codon:yes stop_codon:yes gene_type:complete
MNQEQKVIEDALKEFQINSHRADLVYKAMQDIFRVVCTRDDRNLDKMTTSDFGLLLLKLSQFFGEAGEGNRKDFWNTQKESRKVNELTVQLSIAKKERDQWRKQWEHLLSNQVVKT